MYNCDKKDKDSYETPLVTILLLSHSAQEVVEEGSERDRLTV